MVILLVLLMVVVLIGIEMWREGRNTAEDPIEQLEKAVIEYETVEGIELPKSYLFHPMHFWIKQESSTTARVGVDDYGRRLIGKINKVLLPPVMSNVESGQSCMRMEKDEIHISLASPISGEIVEQNEDVVKSPELISSDPYESGWLFTVENWNLGDQLKSLMTTDVALSWMKGAVLRMKAGPDLLAGSFAQDGGELVEDFHDSMEEFGWIQVLRENMGTEPVKITK